MRISPVVLALLPTMAALAGCQWCTDPVPRHAVSDQPLGARCEAPGECAAGLECLDSTCTVACAADPQICPEGSACWSGRYCLPGCTTDEDCLLGATVGACAGPPATDPPYCYPRTCDAEADCPVGRCAGLSLASGITWNEVCSPGYCQR